MRLVLLPPLFCVLSALAARPFVNGPDTGLVLDDVETGALPQLPSMVAIPDFEAAARYYMSTWPTSRSQTVLGYNFTASFFIAPAAQAGLAHPRAELNLVEATGKPGVATKTIEEIAAHKADDQQILSHQLYVGENKTKLSSDLGRIEAAGYKAIFVTIDNPIHGIRQREARYGFSNTITTWEKFRGLQRMTRLPLPLKAIYVSKHGGRQLDSSQQPLETCLEILKYAPEIFEEVDVFADGGIRYGTDVWKLLAMGVKMVGLGRSPMYANVFGVEGVTRLLEVMRREVWIDAANLGVSDMKDIDASYLNLRKLEQFVYQL
ncbi:hypothetical protein FN846DRAFT_1009471 [Sphaerosporella brunnea]|uniref:FMN hydroxy acid dehydrogenase domain-containing protein n=1 Tax=Sphaerosporella brunnea TaxID=1250544 RepID=A0A5J5F043_9PEZI|nr:hypothetical protein FN846DRAFT_1009471 [Sphaerosporella brunnea]